MEFWKAKENDIYGINLLLEQVLDIHHNGRPDIFKSNAKKYTDKELIEIIKDETRPIFVAVEDQKVLGYCFCIFIEHKNDNILTPIKTLYIDDLCVDEKQRGKNIGTKLYEHTLNFAKEKGFYNLTLNVWALNKSAVKFYEKLGLKPQKIGMEKIIKGEEQSE